MSNEIRLLIYALAVYRLSELVSLDDGPFEIFKSLRLYLGKRSLNSYLAKELALLINCPFCIGIWISAVSSILFIEKSFVFDFVFLVFGIAGFQTFLEQFGNSRNS